MSDSREPVQCAGWPDPSVEPLGFFARAHKTFLGLLTRSLSDDHPFEAVAKQAFELFDKGVASRADDLEGVACHGGCASCCTIRVVATAPEILTLSRTIRALPQHMRVELERRIAEADRSTHLLNEAERWQAGVVCPFVDGGCGLCVIYSVRPLACRGHVSFDAEACEDALAGHACEVPVSTLHATVRSLVQNAMQSALRDARYAWGVYELNRALHIASLDDTCEAAWLRGEDIFAPASITDVSVEEMAATFDAIKLQTNSGSGLRET
jgi:Fe-S-cluster containining protein